MTRETGLFQGLFHRLIFRFELNDENIRELAYLSDKYIIDSLYREIRVICMAYFIADQ